MKKVLVSALAALAMVVGGVAPAAHAAPSNVAVSYTYSAGSYSLSVDFVGDSAIANSDYDVAYAIVTNGNAGAYTNVPQGVVYSVQAGTSATSQFVLNDFMVPNIAGSTMRFRVMSASDNSSFAYSADELMYSPPSTPTFTAVPGQNPGEIVLNWTQLSGLTYEVRWGSTVQPNSYPNTYGAWASVSGNTTTITGLPGLQTNIDLYHVFQLRATDSQSGTATATTGTVQAPVSVGAISSVNASASNQASGGLYVSWNSALNATGYEISYATSNLAISAGGWSSPVSLSGAFSTSKQYTGLDTSAQYWFKVVPTRGGASFSGTKTASGTAPSTGTQSGGGGGGGGGSNAGTVTSVIATNTNVSGEIYVSWSAATPADGYQIYRSTSLGGSYASVGGTIGGSNTSKIFTGLSPSQGYFFKVSAYTSGGPGALTNPTSVTYADGLGSSFGQTVTTTLLPVVPVFKQPKFEMPSKIDIDVTGKVKLSGKDMGVSSVLIGGVSQKIDVNSDAALEFDTTGLAKGVHDLVMKGAFGTYTIQKAIQVGEAVVTKVAAVSARQVGMAGGELSISGVGLEGTTQITMNGQVLEIISKTDSKVTFKVPASTVASVNSIMIEGSFVPVLFKNAFSYTK